MTEAERIDFLIRCYEGGNGAQFAKRLGLHRSSVSDIRMGRRSIRLHIDAILEAYPAVRREWLETGEGYPGDISVDLVRDHYEKKIKLNERIIDNLMRRIEQLESQLGNQ